MGKRDFRIPFVRVISKHKFNCGRCHDINFLIECDCGCHGILFRHNGHGKIHRYTKGHQARRELHYDFKGRYMDRYGYHHVFRPDHHFADKNGYIMEHRDVVESELSVCLLRWAAVHHINEKKDDNRIENLIAMTIREHKTIHGKQRWPKKDMSGRKCKRCGTTKTHINTKGFTVWCRHPITKEEWYCASCCGVLRNQMIERYKKAYSIPRGCFVSAHIAVYENHFNCRMLRGVDIHHKNLNKFDNRIENLEPMWEKEHNALHSRKS